MLHLTGMEEPKEWRAALKEYLDETGGIGLDMMRTAVNIKGDAVYTTLIADQEKILDREVFNKE